MKGYINPEFKPRRRSKVKEAIVFFGFSIGCIIIGMVLGIWLYKIIIG